MYQETKTLLLGCVPVIEHMSRIQKETILKFDVNLKFKYWYAVSYGDLKVLKSEDYMKTVTAPEDLTIFKQNMYNIMRQMSPSDLKHVLGVYEKVLYDIDIEDDDMNPKASRWMYTICCCLREQIDIITYKEPVSMRTWMNKSYNGFFIPYGWGALVPALQQPTNTQTTKTLLLGCVPVIEHMPRIQQETILKFDVNSKFKDWYAVSYGDLKALTSEDYMKTVTTPGDLTIFKQNMYNIMMQMSPEDLKHVLGAYEKALYDIDIEDDDMNPTALRWMHTICCCLREQIDISNYKEPISMQAWLDQNYNGLFERDRWGALVPALQQPTNTAFDSFGGGGRMFCMRCSKCFQ
jgi:hypothetical protein